MTIIWQNKRFSCEKCIKGHRTNSCGHTKRSLQEIKSAGRPKTQCSSCRVKRATGQGHVHHKCKCGSEPPKPYREYYKLVFQEGLELNFNPTHNINVAVLQVQVQQSQEMEIIVQKAKADSNEVIMMNPRSFATLREEIPAGNDSENPCKCHYGGECICSSLPQDRKKKGLKASDGINMLEESPVSATRCSCSTNCSCSIGGCMCRSAGPSSSIGGGCCSNNNGGFLESCCSVTL